MHVHHLNVARNPRATFKRRICRRKKKQRTRHLNFIRSASHYRNMFVMSAVQRPPSTVGVRTAIGRHPYTFLWCAFLQKKKETRAIVRNIQVMHKCGLGGKASPSLESRAQYDPGEFSVSPPPAPSPPLLIPCASRPPPFNACAHPGSMPVLVSCAMFA